MLRMLSIAAAGLTLICAVVLYAVAYDTRRLEQAVQARERLAESLSGEIAVLRAERAFLARPERIEAAARTLGLTPARGEQYVGADAGSGEAEPPARSAGALRGP